MPRWQRVRNHELDDLSVPEYHEIANAHDTAGWETQRQAFTELRDLAEQLARGCETALAKLRSGWSGGGAEAFTAEFGKLIDFLDGLRDSAASNADGMRELAAVVESTRGAAELLNEEDKAWQSNSDGDDERTVAAMREGVRGELRDTIKDADESFQHLAHSYLLDPPEPLRLGGMDTAARELGVSSDTAAPRLQNAPAQHATAPVAEPVPPPAPVAEPAPVSGPMMPMGGMGMGGPAETGPSGAAARGDGPRFGEGRPAEASRMRSTASRQELHNQSIHGGARRRDPEAERRPVDADDDSPFAPNDTVVPPVISGGVPDTVPHDSGPVLTGTVYRHFPEYDRPEPSEVITHDYADGSSAIIEFNDDDEPEPVTPKPAATVRDDAAQAEIDNRLFTTRVDGEEYLRVYQSLPREKAQRFAAAQAELRRPAAPDAGPDVSEAAPVEAASGAEPSPARDRPSLAELRRRRQERREARKSDP